MNVWENSRIFACAAVSAAAAAFALPGAALAQDSRFAAAELADNLLVVNGPDGNVVVGVEPDGLVMIDGGSMENSGALLDFVFETTGADRVHTLINTHWHPEQTGSNETLGAQGATIVAHANTRQWMEYGTTNQWEGESFDPQPEAALPTHILYEEEETLPYGEGEIRLGHLLEAHTDSDIYAYFPGPNVLVTGAAVRSDGWNMLDWWTGGYMGGVLDAHETLLGIADEDTVIVPVSGPVMTKAELQEQADMYAVLYERFGDMLKAAQSPQEGVAARPTAEFHPEWDNADEFVRLAMRSYYSHLRGNPRLGAIP